MKLCSCIEKRKERKLQKSETNEKELKEEIVNDKELCKDQDESDSVSNEQKIEKIKELREELLK